MKTKHLIKLFSLLILSFLQISIKAQFTKITTSLTQVRDGALKWGDIENDGDLDLLLTGKELTSPSYTKHTYIAKNTNGAFTVIPSGMKDLEESAIAWGDYNNDGYTDVAISGWINSYTNFSAIYKNNAGTFTDINAGLAPLSNGSLDWGDVDNDGDLDLLMTGNSYDVHNFAYLYINDKGTFNKSANNFIGVQVSDSKFGDYDNDGDLDILITGDKEGQFSKGDLYLYKNEKGVFTPVTHTMEGGIKGSVDWGDYDNDGDLDIIFSGTINSDIGATARIYRNDSGNFVNIGGPISKFQSEGADWGDFDNDGDLDAILYGYSDQTIIFRNDTGIFSNALFNFGFVVQKVAIGDYDNDNDLDIAMMLNYRVEIWRNDYSSINTPP